MLLRQMSVSVTVWRGFVSMSPSVWRTVSSHRVSSDCNSTPPWNFLELNLSDDPSLTENPRAWGKKKNLSTVRLPCFVKRKTNEKWWHNYKSACVCVCVRGFKRPFFSFYLSSPLFTDSVSLPLFLPSCQMLVCQLLWAQRVTSTVPTSQQI